MQVSGILETALYVADPAISAAFYQSPFRIWHPCSSLNGW